MDQEPDKTSRPKFFTKKRIVILAVVAVVGALVGRAAVRMTFNLLLGGTMLGGNIL